ncbi:hypothetical protein B0T17DRAFT_510876 [Bombardia bombarda]|uniref:Uncharacterized protein n=1 Tax=Bombardia bombarda TaxID=252184 RepID=A0AA40BVE6_9PEZI|nr:hypothetical protein B0T17DRAFT_510876 [Bombardia bombarda]
MSPSIVGMEKITCCCLTGAGHYLAPGSLEPESGPSQSGLSHRGQRRSDSTDDDTSPLSGPWDGPSSTDLRCLETGPSLDHYGLGGCGGGGGVGQFTAINNIPSPTYLRTAQFPLGNLANNVPFPLDGTIIGAQYFQPQHYDTTVGDLNATSISTTSLHPSLTEVNPDDQSILNNLINDFVPQSFLVQPPWPQYTAFSSEAAPSSLWLFPDLQQCSGSYGDFSSTENFSTIFAGMVANDNALNSEINPERLLATPGLNTASTATKELDLQRVIADIEADTTSTLDTEATVSAATASPSSSSWTNVNIHDTMLNGTFAVAMQMALAPRKVSAHAPTSTVIE